MNKIIIKRIYIDNNLIKADVTIKGCEECIETEISENMRQYVCIDRCDAFVVGLLYTSLQLGLDFESEMPISEDLYYSLEHHFIDAMVQGDNRLKRIKINIPIINIPDNCENKNIVATGISCGVDSLYTIATHSNNISEKYKLTHLAFFDVGALGMSTKLFDGRIKIAQKFAKDNSYVFIFVRSNIHRIINKFIPYSHVCNNTYVSCFCVLLLQNGISKYYYSSGYPYSDFSLFDKTELDSEHYDLLTLSLLSINGIKFFSSGASQSRIDKTKLIATYPPAYKSLNVCTNEVCNCGKCFKCMRTLLTLDAFGCIDNFKNVFDVVYYKNHRNLYLRRLWVDGTLKRAYFYKEIMPYFEHEFTLSFKIKCLFSILVNRIRSFFKMEITDL